MTSPYLAQEPTRAAVEAMPGDVLLEFGAPWCPHCVAAEPLVAHVLDRHRDVRHLRIEDGRGRALGRAFRVKLWPTFVRLRDGVEQARAARPRASSDVAALFGDAP